MQLTGSAGSTTSSLHGSLTSPTRIRLASVTWPTY